MSTVKPRRGATADKRPPGGPIRPIAGPITLPKATTQAAVSIRPLVPWRCATCRWVLTTAEDRPTCSRCAGQLESVPGHH